MIPKHVARVVLVVSLALSSSAVPQSAAIPIEVFAQLPGMDGASLSPDGKYLTFLRPFDGRTHVVIAGLGPGGKTVVVPPVEALDFNWVHWANNDRLVYSMSFSSTRRAADTVETRLFAIDKDGKNAEFIIRNATRSEVGSRVPVELPAAQVQDDVIAWLPNDPDHILVDLDSDHNGSTEVRRVNVNNGRYKVEHVGSPGEQQHQVDRSGAVRFGWGYLNNEFVLRYRNAEGSWSDATESTWWKAGYNPIALMDESDVAIAIVADENGYSSVRRVNLHTGEVLETVFESNVVDADQIIFDPVSNNAIGVRHTVDMPTDVYFDSDFDRLQRSVNAAIPNASNQIISTSTDRLHVLIYSTSAVDPGAFYHWNRETKAFDFVGEKMPNVPVESLSPVRAVSYAARDGLTIPAYLTIPRGLEAKELPTIVLPHGGPESRDNATFDYLRQFLASRGYAVLQPNFRGSSGYGAEFRDAGKKQWGGTMQEDITDGTHWLIDQGIADPQRMCIVGWSYGGYSAAMAAVQTPDLFQCAASINGVLDLARLVADDQDYVGGSVWTRHMGLEGESVKSVSPHHLAERIIVPMLIVQAKDDARVPVEHGKKMSSRLKRLDKDVEYVEIRSGGHSLDNEAARIRLLQSLELFLAQHLDRKRPLH